MLLRRARLLLLQGMLDSTVLLTVFTLRVGVGNGSWSNGVGLCHLLHWLGLNCWLWWLLWYFRRWWKSNRMLFLNWKFEMECIRSR